MELATLFVFIFTISRKHKLRQQTMEICRLCFDSNSSHFIPLNLETESLHRKQLEVVFPEIDLEAICAPFLCFKCSSQLESAFVYKSTWLRCEAKLKNYIERNPNLGSFTISDVVTDSDIPNCEVKVKSEDDACLDPPNPLDFVNCETSSQTSEQSKEEKFDIKKVSKASEKRPLGKIARRTKKTITFETRLEVLRDAGEMVIEIANALGSRTQNSCDDDHSSRLRGKHFPSPYEKKNGGKKGYVRRCVVCLKNNKRRESRYQCEQCDVGLCVFPCFKTYHTELSY